MRKTVLVVEDEILIAMDLTLLLERRGWNVLGPAATVNEALSLLDKDQPAVALLDVAPEGRTGDAGGGGAAGAERAVRRGERL